MNKREKDKKMMKQEKHGKKNQIDKFQKKIRKINQKKIEIKFQIIINLLMKIMNVVKMENVAFVKEFIH